VKSLQIALIALALSSAAEAKPLHVIWLPCEHDGYVKKDVHRHRCAYQLAPRDSRAGMMPNNSEQGAILD